jgi:hypothetical protein
MEYKEEMLPEEERKRLEALREYYDNHDASKEMENAEWVKQSLIRGIEDVENGRVKQLEIDFDDDSLYPHQLELDLGVVPIPWDENTRYSEVKLNMIFDHELSTSRYNDLVDIICAALDEHFPCDFLSAKLRSGTDKELFPEAYDESEEFDETEEEEVQ